MIILYLNIFENCIEKDRLNKIISFIIKQNPDFVLLSEVKNWIGNKKRLLYFKSKISFKYYFIKDHVIIFSKNKLNSKQKICKGVIKTKFNINGEDISIILAHLSPTFECKRIQQIKRILKNISIDKKTILIGDLNSLSPLDNYNEKKLLSRFNKIGLSKFGIDKLKRDVQTKILGFGLIDTLKKFSKAFEYSVPTKFNKDKTHAAKLRLDYIYITPTLLPFLKSSKIIRNKETNQLSDHFPIIAEFDL